MAEEHNGEHFDNTFRPAIDPAMLTGEKSWEQEHRSGSTEIAQIVPAEDFYAHPQLLDREQHGEIIYRPPEAFIPTVKESPIVSESFPLEDLTLPAGPDHPVLRSWGAPDFDLQGHLDKLNKSFVEFGGPTYDEYWVIEGLRFPQKVLISNIEPGLPMGSGENRRFVGGVDFQANVDHMPLADESASAIFASAMPLSTSGLQESMRVLEPGGLLFWNSSSLVGCEQAQDAGLQLVKAVFQSDPTSMPQSEPNPVTGKNISVPGAISFVFMKPAKPTET